LRAFSEENVDIRGVRVQPGARTASCFIAVDRQGQRVIYALGGAAILEDPAELDISMISSARLLFIADALVEVAVAACQAARTSHAPVVFAPGGLMASAGASYLKPLIEQAEVLIAAQAEASQLTGERHVARAAARLAGWGPQAVMITLGPEGALLFSGSTQTQIPPYPVERVRDTTGAGDAFAAGVIAGYLKGLDWAGAAHLGCALAAAKIAHVGPRSGYLQPEQVNQLYQKLETEGHF
jgi:ribokinase